jgi:ribonuclease HI
VGLIAYVDGGSRGNPGPAGAGVVITSDDGTCLHEGAYFLGRQTNNAAEYHALLQALQRIADRGEQAVTIYSDSELLVRQITGQYRVKSPKLAQLFKQVQLLLLRTPCWNIRHIPREDNQRADELANLAMDLERNEIVFDVDSDEPGRAAPSPARPGAADAAPQQPAGEADPNTAAPASAARDPAAPEVEGTRMARVTLARAPKPGGCPAQECSCESFSVESTLPAGLCIHAAHALLPTIIAVLNTESAEFAAVPTLTVRCMHPGCGATFHVSPARSSNGVAKGSNSSQP